VGYVRLDDPRISFHACTTTMVKLVLKIAEDFFLVRGRGCTKKPHWAQDSVRSVAAGFRALQPGLGLHNFEAGPVAQAVG